MINNSAVNHQGISPEALPINASTTYWQLGAAFLLGIVIIFGVGFAPLDIAHNAAHDSRHSHTFPCH